MTIKRDGKDIELTPQECYQAYLEERLSGFEEDLKSQAEQRDDLPDDLDFEELAERLDNALSKCDSYWESFWYCVDNVLGECKE